MSKALLIAVSISFDLFLTAVLCSVIADGINVPSSAFLTTYQSVFDNSVSACFLTISFLIVFNPLVVTPSIVTSSISFPVSLQ